MKIDNAQLAAFAAVLEEGSFDAAARRLHVTPSAISQRIRLLEERLGQVLLQRSSPCVATEAGKLLARFAGQVAVLENEMLREIGLPDGGGGQAPRVPVVVNADSLETWFLSVFDSLPVEGLLRLDVRVEDQDHSAVLLREGAVMAAVSSSPAPVQGCGVELLGVMRYRALASPDYVARHFAGKPLDDALQDAPMLVFNSKDALQARFLALCSARPLDPPAHFIPSVHGFLEAARRGVGWGMMPAILARESLANGALVEITPDRCLDVPLYWHCWRLDSPVLKALSGAVRRAAASALGPDQVASVRHGQAGERSPHGPHSTKPLGNSVDNP